MKSPSQNRNKKVVKGGHQKHLPVDPKKMIPDWVIVGVIMIYTFLLYLHSLQNGFVNWDDPDYIQNNMIIHQLKWENIKVIFGSFYNANYHPLTTLTYALEYSLAGGKSATLYHINNLWIHLVNVFLVFWFVKQISKDQIIAAVAAFWFGIHPMHVESVAWVSERKDVLYGCFFLAALVSYNYYLNYSGIDDERPSAKPLKRRRFYTMTLLFFLFSLLSKSAAVVLPVVFLLIDFYVKRRLSIKILFEKIPFLALSLLFGILAILSQKAAINKEIDIVLTPVNRFFIVNYGFLKYIYMLFYPSGMSAYHPYPLSEAGKPGIFVYLSFIINILIFGTVFFTLRRLRRYVFGLFFFLITIILVLRVLPVGSAVISDRYTYIPYIGLFYIIGYILVSGWQSKNLSSPLRIVMILVFAGLSLIFTIKTYGRISIWKDDLSLWGDVIRVYPDNYWGYYMRGTAKGKNNDFDGALSDLDKSISFQSNNPLSYNNRGKIYYTQKKYAQALQNYNIAISLDPTLVEAYNNRGAVRGTMRDLQGACSDFSKALSLRPDFTEAYRNRGLAEMLLHDAAAARLDWKKAEAMGDDESIKLLKHYFP